MTDVAQLNQGRFYWVLVRSSTKDPEWQPARFNGVSGGTAGAKWDFVGFNRDVGHYFVEIVDIGPELPEGPKSKPSPRRRWISDQDRARPATAGLPNHQKRKKRRAPRRLR